MDWWEIGQQVLEMVLAAVLPVAVGFVVAWLKARRDEMLAGMDEKARGMVGEAVEIAVRAAEQSGLAGLISNAASAKKDYALRVASEYMRTWGIKIDLFVLAGMVEAEVKRQFGKGGEVRILPVEEGGRY